MRGSADKTVPVKRRSHGSSVPGGAEGTIVTNSHETSAHEDEELELLHLHSRNPHSGDNEEYEEILLLSQDEGFPAGSDGGEKSSVSGAEEHSSLLQGSYVSNGDLFADDEKSDDGEQIGSQTGDTGEEEDLDGEIDEYEFDENVGFDIMQETEFEEEEEQSDEDTIEKLKERRKMYYFTKYKQERLIQKYLDSMERLKSVRKKNLYLQDRIYAHIVEKEKILAECRESVRLRKEKVQELEREEVRPTMSHAQYEYLQDEMERTACDDDLATEGDANGTEDEDEEEEMNEDTDSTAVPFDKEKYYKKKCRKQVLGDKKERKTRKGQSKMKRLSKEHYHFEKLHTKKDLEPVVAELKTSIVEELHEEPVKNIPRRSTGSDTPGPADQANTENEEPDEGHRRKSPRNSKRDEDLQEGRSQAEENKEQSLDPDDEWKLKHEEQRAKEEHGHHHGHTEADAKKISDSHGSNDKKSDAAIPGPGKFIEIDDETLIKDSEKLKQTEVHGKRKSLEKIQHDWEVEGPEAMKLHHDKILQRNACRAQVRRRKSLIRRKLEAFREAQETTIQVDIEDDPSEEINLPEFKFVMSDPALTKMKYGDKLRHEMEGIAEKTKLPLDLEWPMQIKGFKEYFQKEAMYGKVIYTKRFDGQIRNTNSVHRKYKYVIHNLNYQRQQYQVMKEVHMENMEHFEASKQKWEVAMDDLLSKVLGEVRSAAKAAFDSSGRRIKQSQIDQWCRDVMKDFENFEHTARIFYRLVNHVRLAIRQLSVSESQGEGVELFEYKHLLRTNETIGAQFQHKQQILQSYKSKCKQLGCAYLQQTEMKTVAERDVTQKFQLSGEMSCLLFPRQKAVKRYEAKSKLLRKRHDQLQMEAGIVPFRNLVLDYENSFLTIDQARLERRDLQMKFNSRVRDVHRIFDNMEEVQMKLPEMVRENEMMIPSQTALGRCYSPTRPQTAPPSMLQKLSAASGPGASFRAVTPSITEIKSAPTTVKRSIFFSQDQSRDYLEKHVVGTRDTITKPLSAVESKSFPSLESGYNGNSPKPSLRPKTAAPGGYRHSAGKPTVLTSVPPARPSTTATSTTAGSPKQRISLTAATASSKFMQGTELSMLIAVEEARSAYEARKKSLSRIKPTAAKTGIVPKVTREVLIQSTKAEERKPKKLSTPQLQKHQMFKAGPRSSLRPFTVPANKNYELENKRWPYKSYVKRSPELENMSKKRMDILLGSMTTDKSKISGH